MEIFEATGRAEIIRTLNFAATNPKLVLEALCAHERERGEKTSIGALMSGRGGSTLARIFRQMAGGETEGDKELEKVLVTEILRELTDEWIETGVGADGKESPSKRDIFRTKRGLQIVEELANETPLRLLVLRQARELAIMFGTEPREPTSTSYSVPLPSDLLERAANEAKRLFLCLQLSDRRAFLCKCRYAPCGRYYELKKPRRNPKYCCVEHQRKASATQHVANVRAEGKRELIDAAGRLLIRWKKNDQKWQEDHALKERLAGKLNVVIGDKRLHAYRDQVSVKWVTRHRDAVEQRRLELSR